MGEEYVASSWRSIGEANNAAAWKGRLDAALSKIGQGPLGVMQSVYRSNRQAGHTELAIRLATAMDGYVVAHTEEYAQSLRSRLPLNKGSMVVCWNKAMNLVSIGKPVVVDHQALITMLHWYDQAAREVVEATERTIEALVSENSSLRRRNRDLEADVESYKACMPDLHAEMDRLRERLTSLREEAGE